MQKTVFLQGEGDMWFKRNIVAVTEAPYPGWLDKVAKFIQPHHRVLEVGCANGRNLSVIRKATGCKCAGVDPSALAVEDGRARFEGLDLKVGTMDQLPFDDHEFDVVIVGFCLYLVDRPLLCASVAEVDRVLKSPGFLIVTDFDPPYPTARAYHHKDGVSSFKMAYYKLFEMFPHYVLVEKYSFSHFGDVFSVTETERICSAILFKDLLSGYRREDL